MSWLAPTGSPSTAGGVPTWIGLPTDDTNDVSIYATLCGHTICTSTKRRSKLLSSNTFPTPSTLSGHIDPNWRFASNSMSSESTSSPYPLYNPAMAVSDVIPIISAPGGSTGGSGSGGSSRSMPSVVSSVVGAIVIIMVVVLVIWCVRKRRKKRRQRQESAQLGDGSMPPTPASLARGGMIYLDRSYSSQSSLSAHTQLPATPRSLLAETSEIPRAHFADSSTTHRQFPSNDVARTQPAVRVVPPVPPPPRLPPRGRADTFGDNPPDELPPYVDPIEEAMTAAASSAAESMAAADLPSAHQPGPPPYHTVDVSVLAEPRP